jgi:hypothetical protein
MNSTIQAFPGVTEENYEILRIVHLWAKIWTQDFTDTQQEC